jgi:hypothetical protein
MAKAFVGIPLVVETQVLQVTRTVVIWFADGVEVLRDSPVYTPVKDDNGKRPSVLIIPVRPGHSGSGCEEAYEYSNLVEPLPHLPLVSPLRDAWTTSRDHQSMDLRVLSYNLLADIYAGREMDQESELPQR